MDETFSPVPRQLVCGAPLSSPSGSHPCAREGWLRAVISVRFNFPFVLKTTSRQRPQSSSASYNVNGVILNWYPLWSSLKHSSPSGLEVSGSHRRPLSIEVLVNPFQCHGLSHGVAICLLPRSRHQLCCQILEETCLLLHSTNMTLIFRFDAIQLVIMS